jgi:hypothetical protein
LEETGSVPVQAREEEAVQVPVDEGGVGELAEVGEEEGGGKEMKG